MAKRLAVYFGAAGYVLVIWYNGFAFAPLTWHPLANALYHACPMCADMTGAAWWSVVLVRAPVNALVYAAVGFLAGGAVQRLAKGADRKAKQPARSGGSA
jgi:hypothetical protein